MQIETASTLSALRRILHLIPLPSRTRQPRNTEAGLFAEICFPDFRKKS
jgi:hypothetical protein